MTLKDIEEKSIHLLLHKKYTTLDVYKKIFETIDKCTNNIKYDFKYFIKIANNSNNKLDFYKIFEELI